MNCRNCGAPMELFEARGYFHCRYCSAFVFPDTVTPERVRILAPSPAGYSCPVCATPLASARLDESHAVDYCEHCRGVLLSRGAFADVVRLRRAWATGTPVEPLPPGPRECDRRINCPLCARALATHPYYGPGNVIIDSCDTCDVIWLDFGELRQIVDAPGRDRGGRERTASAGEWRPGPTMGRVLMNVEDDEREGGPRRWRGRGRLDLLGELEKLFG